VFTTNDEKFIKAREIGDLYEVTLKERSVGNAVYLDLVDYTTNSEMDAFEQNEARREALNDARAMSKKRLDLINSLSTAHAPTNDLLMNKLLQDFNG
jgi:PHD/YefM family antitoxin component YafN of YafNO toxin-antitoxin module